MRPAIGPVPGAGSAIRMLCTPLLLDTHAIAPPVGAATRSVGNGVAIMVSIETACRASGAMVITATAASVRTKREMVFMMAMLAHLRSVRAAVGRQDMG